MYSKRFERFVEIGAAGQQHSCADEPCLVECAKRIKVTIERLVFAVSLDIERYAILDEIDLMAIEVIFEFGL